MAQHDMNIANQGFPAFRSDLNNALSAIQTNHSGTSRPTGAVAGQIWLDTTSATNPTLKFFDGTDDISLATIDYSANTVNWLDSTVSVTGLATTATGTVLTLSDSATTQTVNFIIDNEKEIRFSEADGNGSNYVALKAPASLASDVTFTLPSADGTADQVLKTDGSGNLSFADASGGGIQWQSSIVTTSTLSAVAGNGYWINTTSNACTITLPASASVGDQIIFVDYDRTWGTNAVTIDQNSLNFQGNTSPSPEYNTSGQSVSIVYSGATKGWIPTVDDDVTLETPQSYSIDFLVVAGGGGGGCDNSGGGGGGGMRTSTQTINAEVTITCTVGAGGAGGSGSNASGSQGGSSSISGTGVTTITSAGGGFGGGGAADGGSGGAGGGAGYNNRSGGSGNTPSTSPSQGANGGNGVVNSPGFGGAGGGGGGASGVIGGLGNNNSGNGGDGTQSSITGSSVYYAGGAGGTGDVSSVVGTGGQGGGAAGNKTGTGISGTANLGGGGGATQNAPNIGGSGGSGVVILSVPTSNYSGTTTGSPTITTSGSNTIIKFTGTGTYIT
jgi:hypothetical protein